MCDDSVADHNKWNYAFFLDIITKMKNGCEVKLAISLVLCIVSPLSFCVVWTFQWACNFMQIWTCRGTDYITHTHIFMGCSKFFPFFNEILRVCVMWARGCCKEIKRKVSCCRNGKWFRERHFHALKNRYVWLSIEGRVAINACFINHSLIFKTF